MIGIKFLSNNAKLQTMLGCSVKKAAAVSEGMQYKQKSFNMQHRLGLVSNDAREFFCGDCDLRNSYLNKLTRDAFVKEADSRKGIL